MGKLHAVLDINFLVLYVIKAIAWDLLVRPQDQRLRAQSSHHTSWPSGTSLGHSEKEKAEVVRPHHEPQHAV